MAPVTLEIKESVSSAVASVEAVGLAYAGDDGVARGTELVVLNGRGYQAHEARALIAALTVALGRAARLTSLAIKMVRKEVE